MASEPKVIDVEPGGEIDRLLDEAAERPLRLVRGDRSFRLDVEPVEEDIWANYDPERARQSTLAFAGAWKGLVDAEAFKDYVQARRKTKNRPSVRW